jgi:hypothetical protein
MKNTCTVCFSLVHGKGYLRLFFPPFSPHQFLPASFYRHHFVHAPVYIAMYRTQSSPLSSSSTGSHHQQPLSPPPPPPTPQGRVPSSSICLIVAMPTWARRVSSRSACDRGGGHFAAEIKCRQSAHVALQLQHQGEVICLLGKKEQGIALQTCIACRNKAILGKCMCMGRKQCRISVFLS